MGFIRAVFWFLIFVAATFSWVVLFEHGFSDFQRGAEVEFEKLKDFSPLQPKSDTSDKVP